MNALHTWSRADLCTDLGISDWQLRQLIKDGRVGFLRGRRGQHRFTESHVAQVVAALEVKPRVVEDHQVPGMTAASARRSRRAG